MPHSFWSRLFGLCGSNRFQFWEEKVCGLTAQKASSRPVHWVWLFALPVHNLRRTCFRARTSRCLSANFFLLYSCRFFFSVKAFPEPQRSRIYPMRNPTPNSLYYPDFPTHFSDGKRKSINYSTAIDISLAIMRDGVQRVTCGGAFPVQTSTLFTATV